MSSFSKFRAPIPSDSFLLHAKPFIVHKVLTLPFHALYMKVTFFCCIIKAECCNTETNFFSAPFIQTPNLTLSHSSRDLNMSVVTSCVIFISISCKAAWRSCFQHFTFSTSFVPNEPGCSSPVFTHFWLLLLSYASKMTGKTITFVRSCSTMKSTNLLEKCINITCNSWPTSATLFKGAVNFLKTLVK